MIFSELYSAYYNTVAAVIRLAIDHPIKKDELRSIIDRYAFGESVLNIEPAIDEERWQLFRPDGSTIIKHLPGMPLTDVEKMWLNAISKDPRIQLFTDDIIEYPEVPPLFTADDYILYDKYSDGDDYEDEGYRERFRLILDAIKNSYPIKIKMKNRQGRLYKKVFVPRCIEYSEKDDKFRVLADNNSFGGTYNLGRITSCERFIGLYDEEEPYHTPAKRTVVFEVYDHRRALERVLLHFAHFEKEAEKLDETTYRVTLHYSAEDETEMVIHILSYGPMIKVLEPDGFVALIKERLEKQKSCRL